MQDMMERLNSEFKKRFNEEPQHIFFCPGRVNLIGEHIDYNGGKVMPCAINLGTWLAISKNKDKKIHLQAVDFPEKADLHLQSSYSKTGPEWFNYPLGVISYFMSEEMQVSGLNMLFSGNLPIGSGLSSSASIEVLTAYALNEMFSFGQTRKDLAIIGKKVENEFIGVSCGIMDQFAVSMGKKDHAILLNCDTLGYNYLPLELNEYGLAIINTNKPRKLAESKYNERFLECGMALKALRKEIDKQNLCDVTLHEFTQYRHLINDAVLEKRALHVISENFRVGEAVDALKANQLFTFGKLMYASHQSLKDLYEVSGKELDTIVESCKAFDGCIGARMTGAGFGGCAIALVERSRFDEFAKIVTSHYEKVIGYKPGVFLSSVGDGVTELTLQPS